MIEKTESYKNGYSHTLLLLFLFGALMALLYLPYIKLLMPLNNRLVMSLIASLFLVGALLSSSLIGTVVLPFISIFFGALTALEADMIRLSLSGAEKEWTALIVLLILVPLYFLVCVWGMFSAAVIKQTFEEKQCVLRKHSFMAYLIVLCGTAVFAVIQSVLFI